MNDAWQVTAECQACFEAATGDDAATAACYTCSTPGAAGCICTVAEIMNLDDMITRNPGCYSCVLAASDNTGAVCGGATCGDACTCSAADTAILSAEQAPCSASGDSCVSAECMACLTIAGEDGSACYYSAPPPAPASAVGTRAPLFVLAAATIGAFLAL